MVVTSPKTLGEASRLPPTLWPRESMLQADPSVTAFWRYGPTLLDTALCPSDASAPQHPAPLTTLKA